MTMVLRRFTLLFANGWQRRRDPLWRPRRGGDEDDEQHDGDCDGDGDDIDNDDDDDDDDIDNADDANVSVQDPLWGFGDSGQLQRARCLQGY